MITEKHPLSGQKVIIRAAGGATEFEGQHFVIRDYLVNALVDPLINLGHVGFMQTAINYGMRIGVAGIPNDALDAIYGYRDGWPTLIHTSEVGEVVETSAMKWLEPVKDKVVEGTARKVV